MTRTRNTEESKLFNEISSKSESSIKKVVVVKSNDFFSLKKFSTQQKERIEDLRKDLTTSNVSFIPKIIRRPSSDGYKTINSNTQVISRPQPKCPLKLPSANCKHIVVSIPSNKCKKMVQVTEDGSDRSTKFVDFANLSMPRNATISTSMKMTTATKNEPAKSECLSEEKVISLINEKYGDALEAQLPFFQRKQGDKPVTSALCIDIPKPEVKKTQESKSSNVIYHCKLKEDKFSEHIDKEQDANKYAELESLLILDSPEEDNFKPFTPEELKKLPDRIFASPIPPSIKEEVKEEIFVVTENSTLTNQGHNNMEITVQEQNLEGDDYLTHGPGLLMTVNNTKCEATSHTVDITEKQVTNADVEIPNLKQEKDKDMKNIWDIDVKDLDFDVLIGTADPKTTKSILSISDTSVKTDIDKKLITIATEDAVIFKEMDKIIENTKENATVLEKGELPGSSENKEDQNQAKSDTNDFKENVEVEILQKAPLDEVERPEIKTKDKLNETTENINIVKELLPFLNIPETFGKENSVKVDLIATEINVENEDQVPVFVIEGNGFWKGLNCSRESGTSKEDTADKEKFKIDKDEILFSLKEVKEIHYNRCKDLINVEDKKEQLIVVSDTLCQEINILKNVFEKLQILVDATAEKIKCAEPENIPTLCTDLNFVKTIVEKSFAKEEENKPKYRVIRISKKNTEETETDSTKIKPKSMNVFNNSDSECPVNISNELVHKTFLRVNRLLETLEKDKWFQKIKQNHLAYEIRGNKNHLKFKKRNKCFKADEFETKFEQISRETKALGSNDGEYDEINASTTDVENKSPQDVLSDTDNLNKSGTKELDDDDGGKKTSYQVDSPKLLVSKNQTNNCINGSVIVEEQRKMTSKPVVFNTELPVQTKDRKKSVKFGKNVEENEKCSRYRLRPRPIVNYYPSQNICKDGAKKNLAFEIDTSHVSPSKKKSGPEVDYVLKNDGKPYVVLYNKTNTLDLKLKQYSWSGSGKSVKDCPKVCGDTTRYETRSKALEKT